MHVTLLSVPRCPHTALLEERLAQALDGRADVTISRQVVASTEEAARSGMHGSPTILLDGVDPFAGPDPVSMLSCRLYRDGDGGIAGAPSVSQLREAIAARLSGASDETEPPWLDSAGRSGRGRIAPAERGLRAVHQAVLRAFAVTGRAPDEDMLAAAAQPFEVTDVLAELADGDFIHLDDSGAIVAAYPFSAVPTPHVVEVGTGPAVFAMCAIDALGMAAMLAADIRITSADPATVEPIAVTVSASGQASWDPAAAVVYVGQAAGSCGGPSATVCCGYMNFFASHESASAWAAAHPEVSGGILSQARALEIGQRIFGALLG